MIGSMSETVGNYRQFIIPTCVFLRKSAKKIGMGVAFIKVRVVTPILIQRLSGL